MKFVLHPWQILLLALAAWLNRQQQQTIEYLITENQGLSNELIQPEEGICCQAGEVRCRERLGGLLRY